MEADGDFIGSKKANSGRAGASGDERSEGSSLPALCPPIPAACRKWQAQDAFSRPFRVPDDYGLAEKAIRFQRRDSWSNESGLLGGAPPVIEVAPPPHALPALVSASQASVVFCGARARDATRPRLPQKTASVGGGRKLPLTLGSLKRRVFPEGATRICPPIPSR